MLHTDLEQDPTMISEPSPTVHGESTLAFLAEGYRFGHDRFERFGSDAFRCRLAGRRALLLRGQDAARFFYEGERFARAGALPRSVMHSLQDEGSVQALAGSAHRHRKILFTSLLDATERQRLATAFDDAWTTAEAEWRGRTVDILTATSAVLTRAVLAWAGIAATPKEERARTDEFVAMIDGAGSFGPRNWRGRLLRHRTEQWAKGLIVSARNAPGGETPLATVANWREESGDLLSTDVATVELLNLLRPTVAVGRFIAFAALALDQHPTWRTRVAADDMARDAFTAEVRRTAPFFPAIAGTATRDLTWRGDSIDAGDWVILDLFATNRHPREWDEAWRFAPERFLSGTPTHRVVAQGAGEIAAGHRCPGEPATVDLLAASVRRLATLEWTASPHPVQVDLRRLPAAPGRRPGRTIRVHVG